MAKVHNYVCVVKGHSIDRGVVVQGVGEGLLPVGVVRAVESDERIVAGVWVQGVVLDCYGAVVVQRDVEFVG